ncbi:hypothetical protein [Cohnella nanjingensis]|uniref:Uncharacterized protein n=1 Tax=Cohnella nanjingensis TaxID=1387779 RepID=A0A7X0VIU2_9BACL|nr:hypothetical protein [Cohnella nanjingensis]MBB6675580.1 hypothetical protein [Cohnella nanjingensis]
MRRMQGLEMTLPSGMPPGFLDRIAADIADRTTLFDRHGELLVLDEAGAVPEMVSLLARRDVATSSVPLLLLPETGLRPGADYADYAFETPAGHAYLDLHLAALFRLTNEEPIAEPAPALLQLEEHLLLSVDEPGGTVWHAIDRQLTELAERIARVYGCRVAWLEAD